MCAYGISGVISRARVQNFPSEIAINIYKVAPAAALFAVPIPAYHDYNCTAVVPYATARDFPSDTRYLNLQYETQIFFWVISAGSLGFE